jgi:hypothetical protein
MEAHHFLFTIYGFLLHDTVRVSSESVRGCWIIAKLMDVFMDGKPLVSRGIHLAGIEAARLFLLPPHARSCKTGMRRPHVVMKKLKRILMAAVMCCIVSAGAFAQKQDPKDPPPKQGDQPKVRVEEKKDPPPPPRNDDKKKP